MKPSPWITVGFFLSMLAILAAAILMKLSHEGIQSEIISSPLSYYLLMIGLMAFVGTAPVYALTTLGVGKALGIYQDEESSQSGCEQ